MGVREPSAKYLASRPFRQTELGAIPADWIEHTIENLIDFKGGSQPDKSVFSQTLKPGYIRLIQIRDYKSDRFETYIPRVLARRFCGEDDIMIGRYGPPIFQVLRGLAGAYNVALIKATPHPEVDRNYAYYYLTQEKLFRFVEKLSQRSSGQTGVDLKELRLYPFPIPPTEKEQEAIADALSDADALIESLEQLLAKKRNIKQGAMQELLTGNKRLPGFSGEWEGKSMGELFEFSGGFSASREQLSFEGHCYLHYGDIHMSPKTFVDVRAEYEEIPKLDIPLKKISPSSLLVDGDVVFVDASEDDEGVSKHVVIVNKDRTPFISGLHTIVAKTKGDGLDHAYRRFCFQTSSIKQQFRFFAVGTKVSGISKANIGKVRLPVPPNSEQAAIAAILSDMDAEIAALGGKLIKARGIKQGMMQELLTGRIRLV